MDILALKYFDVPLTRIGRSAFVHQGQLPAALNRIEAPLDKALHTGPSSHRAQQSRVSSRLFAKWEPTLCLQSIDRSDNNGEASDGNGPAGTGATE